jgi:hypothetical protein
MSVYTSSSVEELLWLLLDAWQQFAYRVPGHDEWAHDGGLSALERIGAELERRCWLRRVSERPEMDWYMATPPAKRRQP